MLPDRGEFENFRKSINPSWIEKALEATGAATIRRRRLPAEQVIWLVLGMALFRNLSITEVVRKLDLVLPGGKRDVAKASVSEARSKLGPAPLKWLFEFCSRKWAEASARTWSWRGLSVYGVDGTTVRVPDSAANHEHFGRSTSGRGAGGYPMLRLVTLMALRSHLMLAARYGSYRTSERTLALELWDELPRNSLVLFDKGFWSAETGLRLSSRKTHWLTRARNDLRWKTIRRLGRGDELVQFNTPESARKEAPDLPATFQARVLRYQRRGFQPQKLMTSLLDDQAFPAAEIAELYHERWELELGYDEVKTEMLEREEAIRSQSPAGIEQEIWGIGLAYNLIRLEMERAARAAGVPPCRISFVAGLHFVRDELVLCSTIESVGTIPKLIDRLTRDLASMVLPPRRSDRAYPRAVKIKMTNYPRKKVVHL
jgi:hypothetical protein